MAIYRITTANSVLSVADNDVAFDSDTPAADTLIVNAGAYLKALGNQAMGAYLDNTLPWTVQVNGLIHSEKDVGLYVDVGNVQPSTVFVGASGQIYGGSIAFYNPNSLTNAGLIYGLETGIYTEGTGRPQTIKNNGTIHGGAYSIFGGSHAESVTNSGFIEGDIVLGDGNDQLINSHVIFDAVDMGAGDDAVTVATSGNIAGDLTLGGGHDKVTNIGAMAGIIFAGEGNDALVNKGVMVKDVFLGNGSNSLTNSGFIYGSVFGGTGTDVVKSTGVIEKLIDLGSGDDVFTGGRHSEVVVDGAGSDTVKLGGGDDFYFTIGNFDQAEDGVDIVDGGAGFDALNAVSAIESVFINLDNKPHDFSPFNPGVGVVARNTLTGFGLSIDTIRNFEAVVCGTGNDIVYGNAAGNLLVGGDGFDTLAGFGGNDVLNGGDGGDALWGGIGRDYLTGGGGVDYFQFASIAESKVAPVARDAIMDFESGIDFIDLRPIDANTKNGKVDDAFTFVGDANFSKTPGELRVYAQAGLQIVEGDVNGDGKADFSIEVATTPATNPLTAADFLL